MSLFPVVFRPLDEAGTAFVEVRRENGHGSEPVNPTHVSLADGQFQVNALTDAELRASPVQVRTGADLHPLGEQLTPSQIGLVTQTVIHGWSTAQGGQYHDVKVTPSGALTVEASVTGVVSIEGTVNIAEPVTVDGAVALDAATLAALETINVGNFPASQTVNGTVTANLGTLNGAATAANQTTTNSTLASLDNKTPDESGTWGYNAGTNGTLTVAANKRILAITATAGLIAATMTINGGQTINIPVNGSLTINPRGNLTAPTIVFTNTTAYFVEFVE